MDSFGGPAYKPRSPPHRAVTIGLSGQFAKHRTLFENVRNFWKRFAGGGRCERTVLCKHKVSPMNLERLLQCEVDEHGLNWAGYVHGEIR